MSLEDAIRTIASVLSSEVTEAVRRTIREETQKIATDPRVPVVAPPAQSGKERLLTTADVKARTGMTSNDTVLKWIDTGRLPASKLNGPKGRWSIRESDLERFIANGRSAAPTSGPVATDEEATRILQKLGKR